MVCSDCPHTVCIGPDCAKLIEDFNAVSKAFPNLKGVFDPYHSSNSEKQTSSGTSTSPSVSAAERPALEECI